MNTVRLTITEIFRTKLEKKSSTRLSNNKVSNNETGKVLNGKYDHRVVIDKQNTNSVIKNQNITFN